MTSLEGSTQLRPPVMLLVPIKCVHYRAILICCLHATSLLTLLEGLPMCHLGCVVNTSWESHFCLIKTFEERVTVLYLLVPRSPQWLWWRANSQHECAAEPQNTKELAWLSMLHVAIQLFKPAADFLALKSSKVIQYISISSDLFF